MPDRRSDPQLGNCRCANDNRICFAGTPDRPCGGEVCTRLAHPYRSLGNVPTCWRTRSRRTCGTVIVDAGTGSTDSLLERCISASTPAVPHLRERPVPADGQRGGYSGAQDGQTRAHYPPRRSRAWRGTAQPDCSRSGCQHWLSGPAFTVPEPHDLPATVPCGLDAKIRLRARHNRDRVLECAGAAGAVARAQRPVARLNACDDCTDPVARVALRGGPRSYRRIVARRVRSHRLQHQRRLTSASIG
jgi:hypothetical protein